MGGKEESLCTDGNSLLGLHSHYVCYVKPPDKEVTFLMANVTIGFLVIEFFHACASKIQYST